MFQLRGRQELNHDALYRGSAARAFQIDRNRNVVAGKPCAVLPNTLCNSPVACQPVERLQFCAASVTAQALICEFAER